MKSAIFATTLIASVAAFAPASQQGSSSTALDVATLDMSEQVGAQQPLGVWDPLGIFPNKKEADTEQFERLRWVELKHGRISMLAVVGYLVTEAGVRFPGAENVPSGFAALESLNGMVLFQFAATMAMMEAANQDQFQAPWGMGDGTAEGKADFKGDFRNGALDFGWDKRDAAWKLKKRGIELNNGRAAMMGILGLMVHEKLGNLSTILPLSHH
mmetsp:Transcript_13903/g.13711  ORF Transcript_13903/g.13711 Transcript_13903/m.13711 type:complete len:214 (-) Transcript_13903:162-803(-)